MMPTQVPEIVGRRNAKRDKEGWLPIERMFVAHYLALNTTATDAALAAGVSKNRKTAREWASRTLAKPHVITAIEAERMARAERLSFTADDVLRELLKLKVQAEGLGPTVQALKLRREILKDAGEHIAVGAFRRNVGLSSPSGGPIETADLAVLATLSDEELDQLERATAILDRARGGSAVAQHDGDPSGEGAAAQGE